MSKKTLGVTALMLLGFLLFPSPGVPEPEKVKVLYVGASPPEIFQDEQEVILDKDKVVDFEAEYEAIKSAILGCQDSLKFNLVLKATTEKLISHLSRDNPNVVHFSVHGVGDAIYLHTESGRASRPLTQTILEDQFAAYNKKGNIQVVVFNSCKTSQIAKALSQVVGCAIGMEHTINSPASKIFAGSFYRTLSQGFSVKTAFETAVSDMKSLHTGEDESPKLFCRKQENKFGKPIDPGMLYPLPAEPDLQLVALRVLPKSTPDAVPAMGITLRNPGKDSAQLVELQLTFYGKGKPTGTCQGSMPVITTSYSVWSGFKDPLGENAQNSQTHITFPYGVPEYAEVKIPLSQVIKRNQVDELIVKLRTNQLPKINHRQVEAVIRYNDERFTVRKKAPLPF